MMFDWKKEDMPNYFHLLYPTIAVPANRGFSFALMFVLDFAIDFAFTALAHSRTSKADGWEL